jgi:hypothetical protein
MKFSMTGKEKGDLSIQVAADINWKEVLFGLFYGV